MPFYDYKCNQCGQVFEVSHGMNGRPAGIKCAGCGSADLQRVFQPVGLMKNGGGLSAAGAGSGSCSSCSSGSCGSCGH